MKSSTTGVNALKNKELLVKPKQDSIHVFQSLYDPELSMTRESRVNLGGRYAPQ